MKRRWSTQERTRLPVRKGDTCTCSQGPWQNVCMYFALAQPGFRWVAFCNKQQWRLSNFSRPHWSTVEVCWGCICLLRYSMDTSCWFSFSYIESLWGTTRLMSESSDEVYLVRGSLEEECFVWQGQSVWVSSRDSALRCDVLVACLLACFVEIKQYDAKAMVLTGATFFWLHV